MQHYKSYQGKTAARQGSDYTPDEQRQLRLRYIGAFSRLLSRRRAILIVAGAFVGYLVYAFSSSSIVKGVVVVAVITGVALLWGRPLVQALTCPGCGKFVSGQQYQLGSYCPECGHPGLEPGRLSLGDEGRYCGGCGKTLKIEPGRGANYDTRACTFCGLMLADESLLASLPSPAGPVSAPQSISEPMIPSRRAKITERDGVLEILIPLRIKPFRFLFAGVWSLAWGVLAPVGAVSLIMNPSATPSYYLGAAILLAIWIFVVPATLHMSGSSILGRDRVRLADQMFQIRHEAFGLGIWRRYRMRDVGYIRSSQSVLARRASIVGECRKGKIEFGEGLDPAEAQFLAEKITHGFARALGTLGPVSTQSKSA